MREMAYLLAGKWEEYEGKRASIYPTFQNWVNRQEKDASSSSKKYSSKKQGTPRGKIKSADFAVEAFIQAQGLHPASPEATVIRRNWGK